MWSKGQFSFVDIRDHRRTITQISGIARQKMLFEHLVCKTKRVAIGPLEYCGNGLVVHSTHRKKMFVWNIQVSLNTYWTLILLML